MFRNAWRIVLFDRHLDLTREEKRRAFLKAGNHLSLRRFFGSFLLIFLPIMLLLQLGFGWHDSVIGQLTPTHRLLRMIAALLSLTIGMCFFASRTIAPAVWKALREEGRQVCVRCGRILDSQDGKTRCRCERGREEEKRD